MEGGEGGEGVSWRRRRRSRKKGPLLPAPWPETGRPWASRGSVAVVLVVLRYGRVPRRRLPSSLALRLLWPRPCQVTTGEGRGVIS